MATLDLRSGSANIRAHVGDDVTLTVTIVDGAGAAVDVSGYTITANVLRATTVVAAFTDSVGGAGNNVVTLSLSDTQTDTIGTEQGLRWSLEMVNGTDTRQYLGGAFRLHGPGDPKGSSGASSVTVALAGSVALSATVAAGSAGGATALDDLTDVTITTPATGQVLTYNGTTWINGTGAAVTLAATAPVSPSNGDLWIDSDNFNTYVYYSSDSAWVQTASPTGGGGASDLDGLSDVTITTPSTGQVLKYNGSAWVNDTDATSGSSALDDLTDVVITAAASGDILRHNGTNWVDTPGTDHYEAAGAVSTHNSATTSVHGIADTSALIADTIVDAKGDLIVATAADTVTRLPVGATNGHVLTVDSAEAAGVKWAAAAGGSGGDNTTIWLNPGLFFTQAGTVTYGITATGFYQRAQLASTSAQHVVACSAIVPDDWTTFNFSVLWVPTTANTGNVVYQMIVRNGPGIAGGVLGTTNTASIPSTSTAFTAAAPGVAWEVVKTTQAVGPFNAVGGAPYQFVVNRNKTSVDDTYADAVDVLGILLEKVS